MCTVGIHLGPNYMQRGHLDLYLEGHGDFVGKFATPAVNKVILLIPMIQLLAKFP